PCVGLDTDYPYGTGSSTSDSPATPLQYGYKDRQRRDSFTMTLMFRPSLESATFVPIASVPWSWSVHATSQDGGTTWRIADKSATAGVLKPSATTTFPIWTRNVTTCHF